MKAPIGVAWLLATFVAVFSWGTRFGFPHSRGHASMAACVVTALVVVFLGVLFAVANALEDAL